MKTCALASFESFNPEPIVLSFNFINVLYIIQGIHIFVYLKKRLARSNFLNFEAVFSISPREKQLNSDSDILKNTSLCPTLLLE